MAMKDRRRKIVPQIPSNANSSGLLHDDDGDDEDDESESLSGQNLSAGVRYDPGMRRRK